MIGKNKKLIVTYFTSSEAIATEKICNARGLSGGRIITTPRQLTADCGMAFSIGIEHKDEFEKMLKEERIKYDRIVELDV